MLLCVLFYFGFFLLMNFFLFAIVEYKSRMLIQFSLIYNVRIFKINSEKVDWKKIFNQVRKTFLIVIFTIVL